MKHRPTLLLVDDDKIYCDVLSEALEEKNYKVLIAHNIHSATKLISGGSLDYAVLDLSLNNESGLNLITPIKEENIDTRIVILTGYASITTAIEAIKLGATHYLTKPATAEDIVNALNKLEGDAETTIGKNPPSIKRLEWDHLQKVLLENDGNISATARALNMHRRTLQRKLSKRPVKK